MYKKKSLGQHFLHNPYYLGLVVDAANIKKGEVVVEVGPGEGSLTSVLLARGAKVVAIEKDPRLIPVLKEKFVKEISAKRLVLIEDDVLRLDISSHLAKNKKYKVVGNIPYYITGALLRKFLSEKHQPSTLVFLIQKEVAQRIAKEKKESILSLSVKVYGTPNYIKTVPRGAFSPVPKVDSAILLIENISRKNFVNSTHEQKFFELIKKGFSQKRKFLKNNLGKELSDILKKVGMSDNVRAEDVPLEKWLALARG